MATSNEINDLQRANFRLCRLTTWPNYQGLGFNLENAQTPPHIIRTVESNSPASAGGLKILDVVLAVNNQDVSNADYKTVTQAIKNARDSANRLDLLVIEKRFYEIFKRKGFTFDPTLARTVQTPAQMPREYVDFPKYTPRTCEMRLRREDPTFGFEAVNGIGDVGAFVQEVIPNTPASRTQLRKSDRILEVDDKFVDNDRSDTIFRRLVKAKEKRAVKLYVVDTDTYKNFKDQRIPLPSKEFRKSRYVKTRPSPIITPYINVDDPSNGYEPAAMERSLPIVPQPVAPSNIPSTISETPETRSSYQDDIRLCRITRNGPTDTYGIELIYHKRDQYHSLKLRSDLGNQLSNAALAGVKNDDHLIEINGENVENLGENEVKQRIYMIKYPKPLDVLVVNDETYEYYKRQDRVIHSGLTSVRKLPKDFGTSSSTTGSLRRGAPFPSEPQTPLENSENNCRRYHLKRIPGFRGYGFTVNSNQVGPPAHKIAEIYPDSPAQQQGLRVGDNIITVNNENVQQKNAAEFKIFLQAAANNAEVTGHPLLLDVINDDAIPQPSQVPVQPSPKPSLHDPPYINALPNGDSTQQSVPGKSVEQPSVRPDSQHSTQTQASASHPQGPKSLPTRPIVSRENSTRSSLAQQSQTPYQNGGHRLPSAHQPTSVPYTNGYGPVPYIQQPRQDTIPRSPDNLTRGTIDLVSRNRLLRYCRLLAGPSQTFGFQLGIDGQNHIIRSIQPESPATRSGLEVNDLLLEVDDENVEGKSSGDVAKLIRNAANRGQLRLLIAPSSVKVLSKRSTKSLTALNDENHYRASTVQSKYTDQDPLSSVSTGRNRSIPRSYTERPYRERLSIPNDYQSDPIEPLPRKCVIHQDQSFRGCGFRLTEKENYDTPIIVEVSPNSPAKRSGLTEGDHIVYVDSQNVQNFRSFEDIIQLIQHTFEKYGQLELVTLTGPAYHVLRKRGGYLESTAFDYQSPTIDQLQPRLCQLKLYNHEHDFGFTLQPNGYLSVKHIEEYSPADTAGLRKDDVLIEINGRPARYLNINQIKQIIEASKEERKLDLLVIDLDGYQYSIRHAIPLNSHLTIVQKGDDKRLTTSTHRHSREPVYL